MINKATISYSLSRIICYVRFAHAAYAAEMMGIFQCHNTQAIVPGIIYGQIYRLRANNLAEAKLTVQQE